MLTPHQVVRPRATPVEASRAERVHVSGKLFRAGDDDWYLKGFTYGPFKPNGQGDHLPEPHRLCADLAEMRQLGCNAVRLYHPPPMQFLDLAAEHRIRVMIDVPWEKHRCFFEDWSAQRGAVEAVERAARDLGAHPAVFAISVANEIPHDVVRFYGAARVGRFIERLVEAAKARAPGCLVTYTNYPSTEFLAPRNLDFYCANVYLHEPASLGRYLDRLQHVAGNAPLILGEYGVDTIRHGEHNQSEALRAHLHEVFRRGLAGSFVFAYTDDWFTGGHQVRDWAFGVTRADRSPKAAARVVASLWEQAPRLSSQRLPRVSVVVCSYNGAATLAECLEALGKLDYPDYEVILIDDGSTDETRAIAARFPHILYLYQENQGLSAARNAGARRATGDIVAYTDSDCVPDRHWLLYLAEAMEDQQVEAIGGPNVPPDSDAWTARCVAASPGGPSHVMLDDRRAEHVPGCNMAVRRDKLLALHGFDEQFRQAGDDVDICWRFLDAGMSVGYAPSALVWHHRRSTVGAYWKQQAGYGRSEAMLQLKHPHRFNRLGYSQWLGVIYGDGAVGLPVATPAVYHGKFGNGLFQIIYRQNSYNLWAYFTLFEWHVLALLVLATAPEFQLAAVVSGIMWLLTGVTALRAVAIAPLPAGAPPWCRPLLFWMHLGQPVVRAWHRHKRWWAAGRVPDVDVGDQRAVRGCSKRINAREHDLYFTSDDSRGREHLLESLVVHAKRLPWHGDFVAEWKAHDVELRGGALFNVRIRTATEELGGRDRFTRVRCSVRPSELLIPFVAFVVVWTTGAAFHPQRWPLIVAAVLWAALLALLLRGRRRARRMIARLVFRAGSDAGLRPAALNVNREPRAPRYVEEDEGAEPETEACLS